MVVSTSDIKYFLYKAVFYKNIYNKTLSLKEAMGTNPFMTRIQSLMLPYKAPGYKDS
jgi:hypothetical protein